MIRFTYPANPEGKRSCDSKPLGFDTTEGTKAIVLLPPISTDKKSNRVTTKSKEVYGDSSSVVSALDQSVPKSIKFLRKRKYLDEPKPLPYGEG